MEDGLVGTLDESEIDFLYFYILKFETAAETVTRWRKRTSTEYMKAFVSLSTALAKCFFSFRKNAGMIGSQNPSKLEPLRPTGRMAWWRLCNLAGALPLLTESG
jgi:hypothetical protein